MKIKRTALLCLIASTLLAQPSRAQTPQTTPPGDKPTDEQAARAAELERKALKLLDEIGDDARTLKLVENRARFQIATADLLWARDEKRAREIIGDALAGVASVTGALASGAPAPDDSRGEQRTQELLNLRREIVQLVAPHDPQLALDFLRGTRMPQSSPPQGAAYYQPDPELALEASLAEQVAARDPKQALRFAEEVLSRGYSSQLVSVLERLRSTDPEAASRLASDIAHKLRASDLTGGYEATSVALYLLRSTRGAADANAPRAGAPVVANAAAPGVVVNTGAGGQQFISVDDQTRRDLLNLLAGAALSAPSDPRRRGMTQNLVGSLQQFAPEIERAAPTQAQALRRLAGSDSPRLALEARASPPQREYAQLMQTGTVDALLDAASKAPPETREQLYRSAAYKAMNEGAGDRARQIVSDHFDDPQQRAQLLRELEQQIFWRAAGAGEVDQARAAIARVARPEDRAGMLTYLARAVAGKGDKEGAARLLEEAWGEIGGRARDQRQFSAQMEAAQAFAAVAPDRAFEIADAAISQLNDLLAAAATTDGFGQRAFEQDELKTQGGYLWAAMVNQCGAVLAALARTDFDRAVATADHLQRTEARVAARLAVARGVLAPNGGAGARVFGGGVGLRPIIRD
ncbi:MAG: hypothetical protein LC746_06845 [Acidobacteria bacterium]|nr:hypothetical protein [Acidobacteriota bacterium]